MNSTKSLAVLFDFDGVIVDTESQYTVFWDRQGKIYLPELENFGRIIKGMTLKQIFEKYLNHQPEVQARISADLITFQEKMRYEYLPGVEEFLRTLRSEGIPTAIVTSSDVAKMNIAYREHPELPTLVDRILTAEMFTRSKPAPDCFLLGSEVLGVAPENCVVFEDSFHGLEAGNRAGMTVVGLATTNPREAITDKAKAVIDDFVGFTTERMKEIINQ